MPNEPDSCKIKKFNELKEEELFITESVSDYNKAMKFFFSQLLHVETNLFIVDKIIRFPFSVFTTPDERIFFTQVYRTFLDDIILSLYKLVVDEGGGFTIRKLRDRVSNSIKSEYKEEFYDRLRGIKFEKKTESLRKKIDALRNQVVAHHSENFALTGQHPVSLYFDEVKALQKATIHLYRAISFNKDYLFLPVSYSPDVRHPSDSDSRSDIEKNLDRIAKESYNSPYAPLNRVVWYTPNYDRR